MRRRGVAATSRPIESLITSSTDVEARELGITPGDPIYVIERVRLADAVPMAIERVALPTPIAAAIDTDLESGSLHAAFAASGMMPSEAHSDVSARLSTDWEQEYLEIGPNTVVLVEERTIFDQEDQVLEHTVTL